jgi:phosphoribosylglycinamide formyltransferase-1
VNIHPSLLPKYPGLKTHELAIADKLQVHGCTIHFVNQNLDAGPIIAQAEIKISPEETVEKLKDRVHKAEHFLYPTVLKWFAQGRVQLKNDQVLIDQIKIPKNGLKFVLNI